MLSPDATNSGMYHYPVRTLRLYENMPFQNLQNGNSPYYHRIFGGIQCPVIKMDDTHTYVVRRNSAYFSGFQFKVYGTGGEKFSFTVSVNFHTLNNAHTRRAPFNAGIHFHTIKPEFGHFQPFPKP